MESVLSPPQLLQLALRAARGLGVEFERAFAAGVLESVEVSETGFERDCWQVALVGTRDAWRRAYDGVAPRRRDVAVIQAAVLLDIDNAEARAPLGRFERRMIARSLRRCGVHLDVIAVAVGVEDDNAALALLAVDGRLPSELKPRKVQGSGASARRRRREEKILQLAGVA